MPKLANPKKAMEDEKSGGFSSQVRFYVDASDTTITKLGLYLTSPNFLFDLRLIAVSNSFALN